MLISTDSRSTFRVFGGASGTSSQLFSFLLIWLSWVINLYEFSEPLHIRYGTQRNVVRQGCTSCIKINFINGEVLYLGIHCSFDLLKSTKFCHGFENISNEIREMQKFGSFLLWNGTTLCSLHFVLQGYVINHCGLFCVFRLTSKSSPLLLLMPMKSDPRIVVLIQTSCS